MRTLDELVEVAKTAESEYKARKEASEKEYQQELLLVGQAKAEAKAALAAGDEEAYTKALHVEQYHKDRASALYKQTTDPYYTMAEHNALIAEIHKAANAEKKVLYKRLYELRKEIFSIKKAVGNVNGKCQTAGYALERAGIPSGLQRGNYQHMMVNGFPASIDKFLKDGMVDYDIGLFYKPKKEEAANE